MLTLTVARRMQPRRRMSAIPLPEVILDPVESARSAGLRYVSDTGPGIRRLGSGKSFRYVGADGRAVKDVETLKRIRALAIPPAWTHVWICPLANGHIQATGRDAKGRKQYRYHKRWREVRDETKYGKLVAFAQALPRIRAATQRDLALPGLPRDKVIATVVRLLERTSIRVGNEEYARKNRSFGLTTLRDRHVEVSGAKIEFHFRGKSGKTHTIDVEDRRLAKIVHQCSELPGHELFEYVDEDGQVRTVESADVNEYLHRVAGEEFTAKDFRTWSGTVLAARALHEAEAALEGSARAKRRLQKDVVAAVKSVAERLGNTPAVCRKCYVHPAIFEAYLAGELARALRRRARRIAAAAPSLSPEEAAVLALLEQAAARERDPRALEKTLAASARAHLGAKKRLTRRAA